MWRFIFPLLSLLLVASPALASSPDLGLTAGDIRFSKSPLVSGDTVRIYASVRNLGDVDTSGYVFFFMSSSPLGESQVVTVPTGGAKDEVWIDFTVPYADFNIRAELKGQNPGDTNSANDTVLTTLFHPIVDDDRDSVEDNVDNCKNTANANQLDTDKDGKGDACDDDDDNDGVSDAVEAEEGTNSTNVDSDSDGVNDADDYYPLDPAKTKKEVIVVVPTPPPAEIIAIKTPTPQNKIVDAIARSFVDAEEPTAEPVFLADRASESVLSVSPTALFAFEQLKWKTYAFHAVQTEGASLLWDFGDGATSVESAPEHTYAKIGTYDVTLTATKSTGETTTETQQVAITFFNLANPIVDIVLILLFGGLIGGVILSRDWKKTKKTDKEA
ncbi:MAG: PKD domain-containing protein [Patescibacteria group bacterium]